MGITLSPGLCCAEGGTLRGQCWCRRNAVCHQARSFISGRLRKHDHPLHQDTLCLFPCLISTALCSVVAAVCQCCQEPGQQQVALRWVQVALSCLSCPGAEEKRVFYSLLSVHVFADAGNVLTLNCLPARTWDGPKPHCPRVSFEISTCHFWSHCWKCFSPSLRYLVSRTNRIPVAAELVLQVNTSPQEWSAALLHFLHPRHRSLCQGTAFAKQPATLLRGDGS